MRRVRCTANNPLAHDGSDPTAAHVWMQQDGAQEPLQAGLAVRKQLFREFGCLVSHMLCGLTADAEGKLTHVDSAW